MKRRRQMKNSLLLQGAQKNIKYSYDEQGATHYRKSEETTIQFGSRKHYCGVLRDISASFERKISVLDVGCGTGRYFHCLQNVERLLGLDVSQPMLDQALDPVHKDEIRIENISLLCADIFEVSLPPESFDFICSIGVLGEDAPFNLILCNKLHSLLKPRGRLFMTIADAHSRLQHLDSISPYLKRLILYKAFPYLPLRIREKLNRRYSSSYMTKKEIEKIFQESPFSSYQIDRYKHSPETGWQGVHYDCLALKDS
jgi:SAM-dependent methyltransferase